MAAGLAETSNVVFLDHYRARARKASGTSRPDRSGWILVVIAALLLAAILGLASAGAKIPPDAVDPWMLVD